MISSISIKNFALIDQLKIKIEEGLTIITGETGAGKSTFLHALNLLSGSRAQSSLIRTGTDCAKIEATFMINPKEQVWQDIQALGIMPQKRLVVNRTIRHKGKKNETQINGTHVNLNQLQEIMSQIIEISGQGDAHHLRNTSTHLNFIDQAAGLVSSRVLLENTYQQLVKIDQEVTDIKDRTKGQLEREDFLIYQMEELKKAALNDPFEDERLRQEAMRLRHAERLKKNAHKIDEVLYAQSGSAVEQMNIALQSLEHLMEVDSSLTPLYDDLQTALAITEETARTAFSYARELSCDAAGLVEIEDRLTFLSSLKQKHKGTLAEVIAKQKEIEWELQSYGTLEQKLLLLQQQRQTLGQSLLEQARALSGARRSFAPTLCLSIERELRDLGMPEAKLEVTFHDIPQSQGCDVDGLIVSSRGLERATLLITANPGEPLLPIHTAASGGELSRITLAIKRVIADLDPVGIYVFDEVDSGVGGPTAEALGLKLKQVSRSRQVLCITHLPQIAGIGDQHLFVSKQVRKERTRSMIKSLTHKQRVEEISRMLGGKKITDRTRANAEELLALRSI